MCKDNGKAVLDYTYEEICHRAGNNVPPASVLTSLDMKNP